MLRRSTIFLALMLTGSLAAAALVSGKDAQTGEVVAPVVGGKVSRREAQPVLPVLQLEKLARADVSEPELDPFAGKSWYVPPPSPPPQKIQEPSRPIAPPLPFGYMGRMQEEDGHVVIYLVQGNRAYSVSQGDTIDGTYRLESVSPNQLVLTYLPLDIKQTLNTGGAASPEIAQVASIGNAPPHDNMPNVPSPDAVRVQRTGNMP